MGDGEEVIKKVDLGPVSVEAKKYDRDLELLSDLNPSIISSKDKSILESMCISYGIKNPVDNGGTKLPLVSDKNFYVIKGKLIALIYDELRNLSDSVIGKYREYDKSQLSISPKRNKVSVWSHKRDVSDE